MNRHKYLGLILGAFAYTLKVLCRTATAPGSAIAFSTAEEPAFDQGSDSRDSFPLRVGRRRKWPAKVSLYPRNRSVCHGEFCLMMWSDTMAGRLTLRRFCQPGAKGILPG
jgi:hypothetical protein